jgi:hypothetical protein
MTLPRLPFATVLLALTALMVSSCGDDEGEGGFGATAGDGGAAASSSGAAAGPSAGGAGGQGASGGEAGSGGSPGPGPGGAGSGGGVCAPAPGDDACETCMKQSCCAEKTACAGDESCACWLDCVNGGTTTQKCFDECGQFSRDSQAQVACAQKECRECGG